MLTQSWSKHSLFIIAIFAMWLQTYITYQVSFDLKIENVMQQLILFFNPLPFLLFFYGVTLFFKQMKTRARIIKILTFLLCALLYGNVVFYRFYSDFITLPVLFQTNNFGDLGNSVLTLISVTDIFYFTAFVIVVSASKYFSKQVQSFTSEKKMRRTYFIFTFACLFLNLGLAETERPQLLTRSFDRELLVKNLGTYNYHIYDIYVQSKSHAQRAFADGSEVIEVADYTKSIQVPKNDQTYGIAKNKNVIIISLESTQNFVINEKVNGQTITPFLNKLAKNKDTLYFDQMYHQTGLGKTSDAEFIIENSLYGSSGGAVFFTNAGNTYQSMAQKFKEANYHTAVLHSNNKSFWNRDLMYQSLNIESFYDVESYNVTEQNSANWGLKDIPFMMQSVPLLKKMQQPFYTRMLTLSNHFPFTSDEEDQFIERYDSGDDTVDQYFQTVRYTDEAIKSLFEQLQKEGLYESTVIVMYGDHYGISENHNEAMAKYLQKEALTPYDVAKLQNVPFFIHIPHSNIQSVVKAQDAQQLHEVAGQIDIRPTILHLLGISTANDIQLGNDLLSLEHESFVAFRDGRYVTDQVIFAGNKYWQAQTGEEITDVSQIQRFKIYNEQVQQKLEMSDQLINGDLLRFYNNETGNTR